MELRDKVKKWKGDDPRAKTIDKLIVQMIATDNLTFTVVQSSFTTDRWSGTTESTISLAAHFINNNWGKNDVLLNVKVMEGSHTREYLA